jgi:hypothetical protein
LEDPDVDGRIISQLVRKEIVRKGVDWIHLAWDWDKWRAVVNAVMNLLIPENAGNFLTG